MDFELSPTEKAFREEVRTWLKANVPAEAEEPEAAGQKEWVDKRRAWQKKLHEAGYVGIGWPKEYGGRGATLMEQLIFNQETIAARAPQPPAENPRAGLTYLLVDMESPGIEVRPLVQITGDAEFNEIFFTDVKVPKSQLLGEAGEGWAVAMTTLLHERGTLGMALATQAQVTIGEVAEHARKLGRGGDRLTRQRIAQHQIEARALQLNGYRAITKIMKDGIPGPEGSLMKMMWSELNQRMTETAIDLMGPFGQVRDGGSWQYSFLRSRANTIEAGILFRSHP